MADEELFNLDDFQDEEVVEDVNNIVSPNINQENINKSFEKEKKEEQPKENSTKEKSDKIEKEIDSEKDKIDKIEISNFNLEKTDKKENISDNENQESDNEIDNELSSNESHEEKVEEEEKNINLNQNLDFKKRHDKMQKWAIEDDLDISSFSQIKNLAIDFPFKLDEFQKRSILRLENHENVLVCAHTSSGKTVVAEYGIALGKKHGKKVLYTSPIKALSNQKFREFKKKFGDVGILTGDVSINPQAQCIIMTTEILQSSLYKNSELLNQVEWVIFDEVHYINDEERGHVWEEILILLPKGIGIIMLSATVPNYMEFAQWVGDIKETKVYVQNTLKRVVPLEHNLYIDENNIFLVKDKDGVYKENLEQAFNTLQFQIKRNIFNKKDKSIRKKEENYINDITYFDKYYQKGKINKWQEDNWDKDNKKLKITKIHHKIEEIVDYLNDKELCPAVIFVFSIKKISEYSKMLSLKALLSHNQEKEIENFYDEVVNSMPLEDRKIPQVQELREILKSGIGVHHSGLLPIIKETIEILYSKGLIKILFATTSFSIGLNMPTRTVVFSDLYKYNDRSLSILSSSEYLQMCGRAGRRGIDKIGNIFILLAELANNDEKDEVLNMLEGKGTEVSSKFRICYRTLLSFYSRNIKDMNEFFRESFLESNMTQKIPGIIKSIEEQKKKKVNYQNMNCNFCLTGFNNNIIQFQHLINNNKPITIEDYPIAEFCKYYSRYKELSYDIFINPKIYEQYLAPCPGRILKVKKDFYFSKKKEKTKYNIDDGTYVILIQAYTKTYYGSLWCLGINKIIKGQKKIIKDKSELVTEKGEIQKYSFAYKEYDTSDIIEIYEEPYEIRFKKKSDDNIWKRDKNDYYYIIDPSTLVEALKEIERISKQARKMEENDDFNLIPLNLKEAVKDLDFQLKLEEREQILLISKCNICTKCPYFSQHYKQYQSYKKYCDKIKELEGQIQPQNLEHYQEFKTRHNILQDLEYVNEDNTLTLKGKAAREIATSDCVLITELLTSDILTSLSDSEVIGFISGFASQKNEIKLEKPNISKNFSIQVEKFSKIYDSIYLKEKSYNFEENKYNRRMTFEYSEGMKKWMDGKNFLEVLDYIELEEGRLYNLIMRIFLMLEEISNFYNVLGNVENSKRFENIKTKLMRDTMAMQSLYLQEKIDIDSIGINQKHKKKKVIKNI